MTRIPEFGEILRRLQNPNPPAPDQVSPPPARAITTGPLIIASIRFGRKVPLGLLSKELSAKWSTSGQRPDEQGGNKIFAFGGDTEGINATLVVNELFAQISAQDPNLLIPIATAVLESRRVKPSGVNIKSYAVLSRPTDTPERIAKTSLVPYSGIVAGLEEDLSNQGLDIEVAGVGTVFYLRKYGIPYILRVDPSLEGGIRVELESNQTPVTAKRFLNALRKHCAFFNTGAPKALPYLFPDRAA